MLSNKKKTILLINYYYYYFQTGLWRIPWVFKHIIWCVQVMLNVGLKDSAETRQAVMQAKTQNS